MIIKFDNRERELITLCKRILESNPIYKNIEVVVENLPIGDIILSNNNIDIVIVERKSIADLSSSIKDGRYEEQSYRLNGLSIHNHNIIYLVEGDMTKFNLFNSKKLVDKKTLYSAMISLLYFKGFSLFRSMNIEESAIIICNMAHKIEKSVKEGRRSYFQEKHQLSQIVNTNTSEMQLANSISISIDTSSLSNANSSTSSSLNHCTIVEHEVEQKEQHEQNSNSTIEIIHRDISSANDNYNTTSTQPNYCSVIKKVKKENITPENIGEIMLCQIPGISSVSAIAVMGKYKTIMNMLDDIKQNKNCLNTITYTNSSGQTRKINKNVATSIITYFQL